MKLCLSGRLVEAMLPRPSLDEFFTLAAGAGYDGVGLRTWQLASAEFEALADVLEKLMETTRLAVLTFGPPTAAPGDWARTVALARRLHVRVLQAGLPIPDLNGRAVSLDPDMRIGPQMHTGGPFENVAAAAGELAQATDPRVGVIAEPANLLLAGMTDWPAGFLDPLRGRIIGCHLQSLELADAGAEGARRLVLRDGTPRYYRRVALRDNRQMRLGDFLREVRRAGYNEFINVIDPAWPGVPIERQAAETARTLRHLME